VCAFINNPLEKVSFHKNEKPPCETAAAAMFGSVSVSNLAAMEVKWQKDRLMWISKQKIVELGQCPSDKMLHKAVLVRNTHSALTTWKEEEQERRSAFAFCL